MASRLDRVLRIVILLQTGVPYNAHQLAEETGVHRRTVYRDIASLRNLGLPIEFDPETARYSLKQNSLTELTPGRHQTDHEFRLVSAKVLLRTLFESGMTFDEVLELIAQAAVSLRPPNLNWNPAFNARRFELIDKEIDGTITNPERLELLELTSLMRKHVDSESNLQLKGAEKLHEFLHQLELELR